MPNRWADALHRVSVLLSKWEDGPVVDALKRPDIVVTNLPLSLFREHAAQLVERDEQWRDGG